MSAAEHPQQSPPSGRSRRKKRSGLASDRAGTATEELRERAHRAIPGGCHTYAKGDDQYPSNAPAFIARGHGLPGLGHAKAVSSSSTAWGCARSRSATPTRPWSKPRCARCDLGSNFNRPSPIEVECAEALLGVVPRADMVKFAKDGSTAVSAAVKLARAHTGRVKVAICADHPFFSYNDWFMVTTGIPGGIPADVAEATR